MNFGPVNLLRKKFEIEWRQLDAIQKMKENLPNLRVFAFEDPKFKAGCRKFIAAELRDFYLWYRVCPPAHKHFYELIVERLPCRLYFDLEFPREYNEVDEMAMVNDFCRICVKSLQHLLSVELDARRDFLFLDSSNSTKFSAHLLVHIPVGGGTEDPSTEEPKELLFPNNITLKPIVMYICSQLLVEKCCLVKFNGGKEGYLCDLTVYSKNRNFRLYQSSKCGKNTSLKLADYCTFYQYLDRCPDGTSPKNAQIFLDSLVVPFNCHQLPVLNLNALPNMQGLSARLKNERKRLENAASTPPTEAQGSLSLPGKTAELGGGPPPSPFPQLDEFMLSNFRAFNPQAAIRVWRFVCTENVQSGESEQQPVENALFQIQYQLSNSRYCMNRGREHLSQNVYWVVDLCSFYFVQRCFDKIDCPNYTSPAFAMPVEICKYLHGRIMPVLAYFRIPPSKYRLPDLKLLGRRYQAASDSFNKSLVWSERYGNTSKMELLTPLDYLTEDEEAEDALESQNEE